MSCRNGEKGVKSCPGSEAESEAGVDFLLETLASKFNAGGATGEAVVSTGNNCVCLQTPLQHQKHVQCAHSFHLCSHKNVFSGPK